MSIFNNNIIQDEEIHTDFAMASHDRITTNKISLMSVGNIGRGISHQGREMMKCKTSNVDYVDTDSCFFSFDKPKIKRCNWCSSTEKLKRCSGCKKIFYCSTSCQRADWKIKHKKMCI